MGVMGLSTKLLGLALAHSCHMFNLAPAFAQSCDNRDWQNHIEEYSPTQRVGSIYPGRSDRLWQLSRMLPTNFMAIDPFVGEAYQLARHEGIDFINTDQSIKRVSVRSVANGRVVYVRRGCPQSPLFSSNLVRRDCGGDWGNHVVVRHSNGLFTRYAHLAPDIPVEVGQRLEAGQELGIMGNSGRSDTRHLHFELGVAIAIDSCAPAQSFHYVYDPVIYLQWEIP